jgi:hypothetical protein
LITLNIVSDNVIIVLHLLSKGERVTGGNEEKEGREEDGWRGERGERVEREEESVIESKERYK